MPRSSAARVLTPPARASAASSCSRSKRGRAVRGARRRPRRRRRLRLQHAVGEQVVGERVRRLRQEIARSISLASSPHVPRERIGREQRERFRRSARRRLLQLQPRAAARSGGRAAGMSSRRSRSGGSADREHPQAIVEVLAEAAGRRPRRRASGWSRRRRARRPAASASSPTGRTSPSCSTRSSFACNAERRLGDLVEEERAAVGDLEEALAVADRAGERAAPWPKSSLSRSLPRARRSSPRRRACRGAGSRRGCARATSSLPVPVSPSMSTVVGERRDLADQRQHLADGGALADDRVPATGRRGAR